MSVYIRNVSRPPKCEYCQFFTFEYGRGMKCIIDEGIVFQAAVKDLEVSYKRDKDCPLEDPEVARVGKWETTDELLDCCKYPWVCSCCKRQQRFKTPYCPCCGAKMEGRWGESP